MPCTLPRVIGALLLAPMLSATACAADDVLDDDSESAAASLTDKGLPAALQELKSGPLDYLPWDNTSDGCYARALYVSMHLASKGIPSNHIYVIARLGHPLKGGRWMWHVAPLVSDAQENLWVLDPVFDRAHQGISIASWAMQQTVHSPSDTSKHPFFFVLPGTSYRHQNEWKRFAATERVFDTPDDAQYRSLKEPAVMPRFQLDRAHDACRIMHRDLGDARERRTRLACETRHLLVRLHDQGQSANPSTMFADPKDGCFGLCDEDAYRSFLAARLQGR
jgi:hypothetical protein